MKLLLNKLLAALGMSLCLVACQSTPPVPPMMATPPVVAPVVVSQVVVSKPVDVVTPILPAPKLVASHWIALPNWPTDDLTAGWAAMLQSCRALHAKPQWEAVCAQSALVDKSDAAAQQAFYEANFTPYQLFNADGTAQGLITGYYEPLLKGSRVKTPRFRYPLYVELSEVYPQLKGMRLRGRLQGKRIVPYANRGEIEAGLVALKGRELFWVENAVELFFLQIQGSGRIELPDGQQIKVGYDNQNGHPYVSIGKKLIEMGELKASEASMQGIKKWAEQHPERLADLLATNPSYVFFRESAGNLSAPLGSLGVPLTNEYSLAVDVRTIPLGAPVFLATTRPLDATPLNRLMFAQDTGGAIKGAVRADFFWGFGDQAGVQAGRMKQKGQLWLLLPKGMNPEP
jgi:membrane-bound lytic murein transglycosylase A